LSPAGPFLYPVPISLPKFRPIPFRLKTRYALRSLYQTFLDLYHNCASPLFCSKVFMSRMNNASILAAHIGTPPQSLSLYVHDPRVDYPSLTTDQYWWNPVKSDLPPFSRRRGSFLVCPLFSQPPNQKVAITAPRSHRRPMCFFLTSLFSLLLLYQSCQRLSFEYDIASAHFRLDVSVLSVFLDNPVHILA